MLLPLYDRNPLRIIPFQYMTFVLIGACVLVFLWQGTLSPLLAERAALVYGMIPSVLLGIDRLDPALAPIPASMTLLTSLFLHGDFFHLIGNMLFLWVFGDNIEDSMGHWKFLVFFLVCGAAGGVAHTMMLPDVKVPTIGASGAVAGVMGAYIVLHPKVKILVLAFKWIPLYLPAYFVLAVWIIVQVVNVWLELGGQVAWWAHIGGFAAGALLITVMRDRDVPLFDRGVPH